MSLFALINFLHGNTFFPMCLLEVVGALGNRCGNGCKVWGDGRGIVGTLKNNNT
jgi:hypothetical protein